MSGSGNDPRVVHETAYDIAYTLASILSIVGIPAAAVLYGKSAQKGLSLAFIASAPLALMWGLIAYSMIFGYPIKTGVIGDDYYGTINKINIEYEDSADETKTFHVYQYSFVYYAFMYALTASAIIVGGIGQHMKIYPFLLFITGSLLVNYCPLAFWMWNSEAWGWQLPIIDYSGGLVVHTYAGFAVLVLGLLSGHKRQRIDYSSTTAMVAAFGLFVGKQALSASNGAEIGEWCSMGALNTIVAAYAGALFYGIAEHVLPVAGAPFTGRFSTSACVKGMVTGFVSMACGAGFLRPEYAVLSTVCSCAITYLFDYATKSVNIAGWDCFISHGVAGMAGAAMIGLYANNAEGALFSTIPENAEYISLGQQQVGGFFGYNKQLGYQCGGISTVVLVTGVATVCLFGIVFVLSLLVQQTVFEAEESEDVKQPAGAAVPVVSA